MYTPEEVEGSVTSEQAKQSSRSDSNDHIMDKNLGAKLAVRGHPEAVIYEHQPVWTEADKETLSVMMGSDFDPDGLAWNLTWGEVATLEENGHSLVPSDAALTDLIYATQPTDLHKVVQEHVTLFQQATQEYESTLTEAKELDLSIQQAKVDLDAHTQFWQRGWMSDNGRFIISVDVLEGLDDESHLG